MLDEKEFFIRKAIGWVLREVGKKQAGGGRPLARPPHASGLGRDDAEATEVSADDDAGRLLDAYRRQVPASLRIKRVRCGYQARGSSPSPDSGPQMRPGRWAILGPIDYGTRAPYGAQLWPIPGRRSGSWAVATRCCSRWCYGVFLVLVGVTASGLVAVAGAHIKSAALQAMWARAFAGRAVHQLVSWRRTT